MGCSRSGKTFSLYVGVVSIRSTFLTTIVVEDHCVRITLAWVVSLALPRCLFFFQATQDTLDISKGQFLQGLTPHSL